MTDYTIYTKDIKATKQEVEISKEMDQTDSHITTCKVIGQTSSSTSFWVFHKSFTVPPHVKEEKRDKITTRDFSIAVPIGDIKSRAFAFLPLELQNPFPFFFNGDFVVSAARESPQIDSPWNKWLLQECLPNTAVAAFQEMLSSPLEHIRLLCYKMIPNTPTYDFGFQSQSEFTVAKR